MKQSDLEASNRSKYGDKSNDLISRQFKRGFQIGLVWCVGNAERYLERFNRVGSSKQGNKIDIVKARDYIQRAIERLTDTPRCQFCYEDMRSEDLFKEALDYLGEMYRYDVNYQLLIRVEAILDEVLSRDSLFKVNEDIIE